VAESMAALRLRSTALDLWKRVIRGSPVRAWGLGRRSGSGRDRILDQARRRQDGFFPTVRTHDLEACR
jgi:hypothetical protein